jgi:hypothetical protein
MRALAMLAAFLIGLSSPVRAADDVAAAAQSVIRSQEQAFSRDDPAAAYSHAAPAIQGVFPDLKASWPWSDADTPRSRATRVLNSAKPAQPTARSHSAFTSSTPTACHGRRCIRWSFSRTG